MAEAYERTERYDGGDEVLLGRHAAEPAEGVTGPDDMVAEHDDAAVKRPTDQDLEDRKQTELQQQRDEHNERLGRPTSPGYTPATDTTPPTAQPEEPATFDPDADPDAGEDTADYDVEESNKKE